MYSHTVTWHVHDLKSSHINPKVNDDFLMAREDKWRQKHRKSQATRGKRHDYLGMTLNYSTHGQVKIEMIEYIRSMIQAFPEDIGEDPDYTMVGEFIQNQW
jgi:hypothetical protein